MTAHPRTDAVRLTSEQVAEIAKRWPATVVVVGPVDNPRYVPVGSIWVGVDGESTGIVLLPDGTSEADADDARWTPSGTFDSGTQPPRQRWDRPGVASVWTADPGGPGDR